MWSPKEKPFLNWACCCGVAWRRDFELNDDGNQQKKQKNLENDFFSFTLLTKRFFFIPPIERQSNTFYRANITLFYDYLSFKVKIVKFCNYSTPYINQDIQYKQTYQDIA